ncbi:MAG: efflux RND transporter permease subunit, partial [Muribaculaceae bacterium]|nr:efflux RND transporter permease subunit [Muribaculaceae bacterium]
SVSVIGGDVTEYQIKLDPDRMRAYGVSLDEVNDAVSDINRNSSGGIVYDHGSEYIVKGRMRINDMDALGLTPVKADGNVLLRDISRIEYGAETPRLGCASVNATDAVLLTVTKQPKASTIDLTKRIDEMLNQMRGTLPAGIEYHTDIFRQSDFIERSVNNLQTSLFEGALMVIVVLFIFMMNTRATVVSVVAMPVSILVSIIILHLLDITINTMSLGGIAIAIGSLVDDAVVDVENVYKRLKTNNQLDVSKRKDIATVIYHASAEVRTPIFNSTLIIIAAFLPLFFLSGIEGRMLIPLGVSFIVAMAASTLVALTLTPTLCCYLLGNGKGLESLNKESWFSVKLKNLYSIALDWALVHRRIVIGSIVVAFIVSIVLFIGMGRSFLPPFNEGSFTINVSTLPGV